MRFTRRTQSARERRRVLPALPEGGGAVTGRSSVERLTAVTDRSATGISERLPEGLPAYSRGRGHSPPRSALGPCRVE